MKNRVIVVTCYMLFSFAPHTASGLSCLEAVKNPQAVLDYISFQRGRSSIRSHRRNLVKAIKSAEPTDTAYDLETLETLLLIPENPKLIREQQQELKTEIADLLFNNYQVLYHYHMHRKKIEEWSYANGNSAIRDKALAAAKTFNRHREAYIYPLTGLHQIVFNLSSKENIGFSQETLDYFDNLKLKEKVQLVGPDGEAPKLNSSKAQSLVESWGKAVRLHAGREEIRKKLSEHSSYSAVMFMQMYSAEVYEAYISNELGLDGALGYYNQSIMTTLMMKQLNDKTSYQNPLIQQLYILVEYRLKTSFTVPDTGRAKQESRLKEPSAIALLSILGELGKDPSMIGEGWWDLRGKPWGELRTLLNQSFDPQIRAYLSSILPPIETYLDVLSSFEKGYPLGMDIFKNSSHNLSSFVQN